MTCRNEDKEIQTIADTEGTVLTDERIEQALRNVVSESTPDILDTLMDEIAAEPAATQEQGGQAQVLPMVTRRRRRTWHTALVAISAAVLLLAGAGRLADLVRPPVREPEVFAVVGLDVNPSIELSLDENQKVISASALNEDGTALLLDLDLQEMNADTACNTVIGAMLKEGYLTGTHNSVLLSVRAEDAARGREIETQLAEELYTWLKTQDISACILGQYLESDEALALFAQEHGISYGKAWLIHALLASGNRRLTEESLLKLSTQELGLLAQEKDVARDTSYGEADTSEYISREEACAIALEAAGLTAENVSSLKAEFECEDGVIIYEVEFTAEGCEYEYDIEAATGRILSSEIEGAGSGTKDGLEKDDDDDDDDDDDEDDNDVEDDDDEDDDDDDD